jgi:16S rRNA (adenine1518-N6/adenine1519-N6)-dimethyltransferase
MMQYYFDPLIIMHLPPGAFRPPPKVDSAIVRFTPKVHNEAIVVSDLKFITTMAFNQRRKTIRNTLKKIISADEMMELGVDPTLRPENLSLDDYVKITKYYSSKITKSS